MMSQGAAVSVRLPPPLNAMYRPNFGGRKGVQKTQECKDWEEELQWIWKSKGFEMIPKDYAVWMDIVIKYGSHERDIDSSLKATLDCLQGYAYENDRQITELHISKSKNKGDEGLTIYVWKLG